jgi:hypothetical protein
MAIGGRSTCPRNHLRRLIDDITCSGPRDLSAAEITGTIADLHAMVRRKGLRLNDKQDVARAGDRKVATCHALISDWRSAALGLGNRPGN